MSSANRLLSPGELKPACILLLVVTIAFLHAQIYYLCKNSFILVFSQRTIMLTHASEQLVRLKHSRNYRGPEAYSRRKDYLDHFSVAQVIIARVFFLFSFLITYFCFLSVR